MLDPMDRVIPANIKFRRKLKTGGYVLAILVVFVLGLWGFRGLVRPVLVSGEFEVDTVRLGPVYETITSTATIELERHHTVLSPATAVMKAIIAGPGQLVEKGDTLLLLDGERLEEQHENTNLQLLALKSRLRKLDLDNSMEAMDNDFNLMAKKVEIEKLTSKLADERALLEMGATSRSEVTELEQSLRMANAEKEKMEKRAVLKSREMRAVREEALINVKQKENELAGLKLQMGMTTVTAPITGVVVSIGAETGSMVTKDAELARLSDLGSYKLTGKVPDALSEHISPGVVVQIIIDRETRLEGTVGNVRPLVKENNVYFDIFPERKDHPRFRPNMTVEIRIVTAYKERALIVKDGPFYDGSKKPKVYRIDGDKATGVVVTTGIKGMDHIEITDGLKPGDRVVVSDVGEIDHLDEVNIVSR